MTRLTDITREHGAAGALHERINLLGFATETVMLMKSGALGILVAVRGVDYECLEHAERRQIVHRLQQAVRLCDEHVRIYQYMRKRKAPDIPWPPCTNPVGREIAALRHAHLDARRESLFRIDLYLGFVWEGGAWQRGWTERVRRLLHAPRQAFAELCSSPAQARTLKCQLRDEARHFEERTATSLAQLGDDIGARMLPSREAFLVLRTLLNYDPARASACLFQDEAPLADARLDDTLCDSPLECHRDHLRLGDQFVKVLVLKEPPAQTFAHMLQEIYEIPGNVLLVSEWQREPNERVRRLLQAKRRHYHVTRSSLLAHVGTEPAQPGNVLIDDSAVATIADLGACLTEMEVQGESFGRFSLTLVAHDTDPSAVDRTVAAAIKTASRFDATLVVETYNALNAWLATILGNSAYNLRRLWLSSGNYADLSSLFNLDAGQPASAHLGREYLAVFETEHCTPYLFNLHVDDVGHALILGSTGAGKSFLAAFLLAHAQRYDPITTVFEIGGSYQALTRWCDGGYLRIGLDRANVPINPFTLPPTPDNLHFLYAFVRVLIQSQGQYAMTLHDDRDLFEQVQSLYVLDPDQRRLFTLSNILPRHLSQALRRWVQGGAYGALFDHATDALTFRRFQTFDFQGLDQYPALLEPLLFYVLHRARVAVHDGGDNSAGMPPLKLLLCDEAWRFVRDPTIKAYITEMLKTGRKHNTAVLLATQSSEDFASTAMLPIVNESCPTKLFLANPGMHAPTYQALFGLNDAEMTLLASLRPREQFLLKRPGLAKVLNLRVDPETHARLTTATQPPDKENR
jgi:type IV secretion/conjugal transfer VirB4 family ATPase